MPAYTVELSNPAVRDLRNLDRQIANRVQDELAALAENPHASGVKPLKGIPNGYRIRIGSYRVIYEIIENERKVVVKRIRHRRDAYRR